MSEIRKEYKVNQLYWMDRLNHKLVLLPNENRIKRNTITETILVHEISVHMIAWVVNVRNKLLFRKFMSK